MMQASSPFHHRYRMKRSVELEEGRQSTVTEVRSQDLSVDRLEPRVLSAAEAAEIPNATLDGNPPPNHPLGVSPL